MYCYLQEEVEFEYLVNAPTESKITVNGHAYKSLRLDVTSSGNLDLQLQWYTYYNNSNNIGDPVPVAEGICDRFSWLQVMVAKWLQIYFVSVRQNDLTVYETDL
jgi:hypothetical protein